MDVHQIYSITALRKQHAAPRQTQRFLNLDPLTIDTFDHGFCGAGRR
jgi:hypothetical protein